MKVFVLKAWPKENESIHKEVHILDSNSFKDLHHTLMRAFELGMIKAVCFYVCSAKWRKGQMISFSNPKGAPDVIAMADALLGDYLKGDKGYVRYECRNGKEWLINLELIAVKRHSSSKRYPDWEDTSGLSLKRMNKRAPIMVTEDDDEAEEPVRPDAGEADENYERALEEMEVPDGAEESIADDDD